MSKKQTSRVSTPFWRDKRIIPIILQLVFALIVVLAGIYLFTNAIQGLKRIGITLGFGFLNSAASFSIGEKLIEYSSTDSYARALLVGFLNTLRVAIFGVILTSILGIIIGVARLSNNWLARNLAKGYVEIFRNTPLLVQIFIWYYAVFLTMPKIEEGINVLKLVYFSNRSIGIPWFELSTAIGTWIIILSIGFIISIVLWRVLIKKQVESGQRKFPAYWSGAIIGIAVLLGWVITSQAPASLTIPVLSGNRYVGGYGISPSFAAILLALVTYTAAFIGEIVRAGIQAVSKGQVEAAKALGFKSSTTLRLIVFPQAVRIIIPPVTSQYLNLIKNSSLAVAVAYPDIVHVASTTINQTGRAIEGITILIIVYLTFSLLTSLLMNIFNKYTQLVER